MVWTLRQFLNVSLRQMAYRIRPNKHSAHKVFSFGNDITTLEKDGDLDPLARLIRICHARIQNSARGF